MNSIKSSILGLSNRVDEDYSSLSGSLRDKADSIKVGEVANGVVYPNTYLISTINDTYAKSYTLYTSSFDETVYREYILELKCNSTPSAVSFKNNNGVSLDIKWTNNIAPIFEDGYTYLISIANNFGVFAQYPNS